MKKYATKIHSSQKDSLNIAIANVKIDHDNFEGVLHETPNRSHERYQALTEVVNDALRQKGHKKVDILVFPESYLPIEWIPLLTRTAAKNQMAIITGVEHFIYKKSMHEKFIFNLTLTILPYQIDDFSFAHLAFHFKMHFSPEEERLAKGYRFQPILGHNLELYVWHEIWFPIYCCFEIASITYRSAFYSYSDFLIVVEWNKDVPYL